MAAKKKSKSRVNEAGNYTKPALRKRIFNRIKAGGKALDTMRDQLDSVVTMLAEKGCVTTSPSE